MTPCVFAFDTFHLLFISQRVTGTVKRYILHRLHRFDIKEEDFQLALAL